MSDGANFVLPRTPLHLAISFPDELASTFTRLVLERVSLIRLSNSANSSSVSNANAIRCSKMRAGPVPYDLTYVDESLRYCAMLPTCYAKSARFLLGQVELGRHAHNSVIKNSLSSLRK